jgi:hypothetical protein
MPFQPVFRWMRRQSKYKRLRVSYPTAELLVRKLVRAEILAADKIRRRNRVFHASEILNLIQNEV